MAVRLLHFSRVSHFSKRSTTPVGQFIAKRRFKYDSSYSKVNFYLCKSFYSCNLEQSKRNLGVQQDRVKFEFGTLQNSWGARTPRRFYSRGRKTSKDTKGAKKLQESDENYDLEEDFENIEVLEELREITGLEQGHKVLVIQPDFKWGRNRFHLETVDHMLGEALSLVHSINDWSVIEGRTEPIRKPDARYFFGKGKLEELTKLVKKLKVTASLSAVFLDVGRLTRKQHAELEELWEVKVFDRFSLVVQIFKERAVTSEAKVQVELAELGYIRYAGLM